MRVALGEVVAAVAGASPVAVAGWARPKTTEMRSISPLRPIRNILLRNNILRSVLPALQDRSNISRNRCSGQGKPASLTGWFRSLVGPVPALTARRILPTPQAI